MNYKIITILGALVIFLFGLAVVLSGGWDNLKLRSVPYRSYFTVKNNPLLQGRDADLTMTSKGEKKTPRIELSELLPGGPPKDGIPALDNLQFDRKDTTPFSKDELILGVVLNGEAKAYPYGILNWHEIVNDTVGGVDVTITYCPLCDTGITFERVVNGRVTTFGVSGKLYQSCLVMYDRLTDSLWSQPWGLGILGEETNTVLRRFPTYKTTLGSWLKQYPESRILSADTGYSRDYLRYPYGTYYTDSSLIFPTRNSRMVGGHIKEILYIIWEGDDKALFNRFSGKSLAFSFEDVKKESLISRPFGNNYALAFFDQRISAVRVFETPKAVREVKGEMVVFTDGGEMGLSHLKEIPTTASFAFVYPAFFR